MATYTYRTLIAPQTKLLYLTTMRTEMFLPDRGQKKLAIDRGTMNFIWHGH